MGYLVLFLLLLASVCINCAWFVAYRELRSWYEESLQYTKVLTAENHAYRESLVSLQTTINSTIHP